MSNPPTTFDQFNVDVAHNEGYLYTTNAGLSSRMAGHRQTRLTRSMVQWRGRSVIDIGCGDGIFTVELFDHMRPGALLGVDLAEDAVALARRRAGGRAIDFAVHSVYDLPYPDNSFDIAHIRAVLHHLEDPVAALREALRVAPTIFVLETNGYNPGVKLLEKLSPYHVEHQEKSYAPGALDRWVGELGGSVVARTWAGFVPMFCPPLIACTMKYLEPLVENTPLLRRLGCCVYCFTATRAAVSPTTPA